MNMSKPDYELKIKQRDSKYSTRVGAAWKTRSGDGINIKIDAGISISSLDGVDVTLWPFRERDDSGHGGGGKRTDGPGGYQGRFGEPEPGDFDDVPF